jgi:hypothetical protein
MTNYQKKVVDSYLVKHPQVLMAMAQRSPPPEEPKNSRYWRFSSKLDKFDKPPQFAEFKRLSCKGKPLILHKSFKAE